jgi:hypothetical protein
MRVGAKFRNPLLGIAFNPGKHTDNDDEAGESPEDKNFGDATEQDPVASASKAVDTVTPMPLRS